MTEEKKVVLKMLEEGKISVEEAERLLETFKTEASQRAEKIKADISSGLAKIGTGVENAAKSVAKLNPKDKIDAYREKVKNEPPITFTNTEGAGGAVPNDVQSASEDSESNTEDLQQSLDKLAAAYNGINKEEIENIVKDHARSASIAAASAAWVSGAGPTMATMACGGFVWSMAYRLNKSIGIELSRNETKKAANAVLHTISSKEVTSFLAASGLSFIPVVGNIASDAIMASVCYNVTFASGAVYLAAIAKLMRNNGGNALTGEQVEQAAATVVNETDMSKIIEEAQASYEAGKEIKQSPIEPLPDDEGEE